MPARLYFSFFLIEAIQEHVKFLAHQIETYLPKIQKCKHCEENDIVSRQFSCQI